MRKLALFSAGFAIAAAIYVYISGGFRILWACGLCLLLSPVCLRLGLVRCSALLVGLAAGIVWCFAYGQLWMKPAEQAVGTEQVLSVQVLDVSSATTYGARMDVQVTLDDRRYTAVLYGSEELLETDPGDTVRCTVEIQPSLREEKDDMRFYHRASDAVLLLYADGDFQIEKGKPAWPTVVRLWFQKRISALYDEAVIPLLKALLTGDQSNLSYAQRNDLSVTGLSHAVAVSGLHVSIVLSFLAVLVGHNPRLTAVLGIPLVVAFVLMTGASPSACRAAVMQILMLTAPLVRRENDPWTNLSAASLILLMENPWAIASVSYQLSFAAVAGLLLFASPLQRRLLGGRKNPGRVRLMVISGISACLAATVATLPLTIFYFGQISICAILTNLLCLWTMSVMLIFGLLSCLLGAFGALLALPVTGLSYYVLWLTERFARFPYAAADPSNLPLMIWTICAYGLTVYLLLRKKPISFWPVAAMTVAFLLCVFWGRWDYGHDAPVYRVLDVGQGQCVLMEFGETTAMVDCGGGYPEEAGELAVRTLHSGGKTYLDILVLTHYDADHAGGAEQLLHRMSVGMVLLPDVTDETGMRAAIEKAAEEAGAQVVSVSDLTNITFSGGEMTIYPPLYEQNDNNGGICVLATAEEYDMLITGDLDQMAELRLMSHWDIPTVEVLAAGHHGAKTSTGETLLEVLKPQIVTISVGADNPYGHPAPETLDRIARSGASVIRTDESGTIVLRRR